MAEATTTSASFPWGDSKNMLAEITPDSVWAMALQKIEANDVDVQGFDLQLSEPLAEAVAPAEFRAE